jgi:hypothetical protein
VTILRRIGEKEIQRKQRRQAGTQRQTLGSPTAEARDHHFASNGVVIVLGEWKNQKINNVG